MESTGDAWEDIDPCAGLPLAFHSTATPLRALCRPFASLATNPGKAIHPRGRGLDRQDRGRNWSRHTKSKDQEAYLMRCFRSMEAISYEVTTMGKSLLVSLSLPNGICSSRSACRSGTVPW